MYNKDDLNATMSVTAMICGTIVVAFILCCLTYGCTQPTRVNQEEQAKRIIENNKMIACVRHGGSWMPVIDRRNGDYMSSEMSCVTPMTLPLVTTMNTKKGD